MAKGQCTPCYKRDYHTANQARIKARKKLYYDANKHKNREQRRQYRDANRERIHAWRTSTRGRYQHARSVAKRRGISFTITEAQYGALIQPPCYYCEGYYPPVLMSIGLDRIDNSRGYEPDNCLACCGLCNRARGDWWTPEQNRAAVQAAIQVEKANGTKQSAA